ncbi:MAG: serine/threonine-protein kinase, partial [Thermoanaerobaculia bacterium]
AHYRILKRIGRGGMGIVYSAIDERDGRPVALKVIREAEASGDESAPHVNEAKERFQREAAILEGLLHVNIVSFYEIGEEDGTPYLAMEFLEGQPLTHFAGRPYLETLPLLIQAAHGMEYLATRGIVHRDLSPDNMFVVENGPERIVKLLDFGIAKLFEAPSGFESLTATGFFLGKVAYGSPEQLGSLGHGAPLDWRSDVYSLGVIFYQVLAGRRPFEGKAPVEYIAAHLNVAAPPVAAPPDSPVLPMGLVRLVAQMLEKRREDRPRTYREIIDCLVATLREEPHAFREPAPAREPALATEVTNVTSLVGSADALSKQQTIGARSSRPTLPLGRVLAAVVMLGVVLGFLVYRGWKAPPRSRAARPPDSQATPFPRAVPPFETVVTPAPVAIPAVGQLQIVTAPFAEVVSITDVKTGRVLPLPPIVTTPYVNDAMLPGTYRIVLRCAAAGRTVQRDVTIVPGSSRLVTEAFLTTDALMESLK